MVSYHSYIYNESCVHESSCDWGNDLYLFHSTLGMTADTPRLLESLSIEASIKMKHSFGFLDLEDMLKDRKQNLMRFQTHVLRIHG